MLNIFTEHPFDDYWAIKIDDSVDRAEKAIAEAAKEPAAADPSSLGGFVEAAVELEHLAMVSGVNAFLSEVQSHPNFEEWQRLLFRAIDIEVAMQKEDEAARAKRGKAKKRSKKAEVSKRPSDKDRVRKLIAILKKNFARIHAE